MAGNRTIHQALTWARDPANRARLHFAAPDAHILGIAKSPSAVSSSAKAGNTAGGRREKHDAARTSGPEAPSGRDWQRCTYCQDRDRGRTRDEPQAASQARKRFGGVKGASREHHRSPAGGDRAQGSGGEVGARLSELAFYYIKSPSHLEIKVDGAIGGPGPTGNNVAVSVYTERHALPQVVFHKMTEMPDGSNLMGDEIESRREGKVGVVRIIQATLHMNLEQAKSVHKWLGEHIETLEEMRKKP